MKILSICHDHPDFTTGGTELQAKRLADHLDRIPGITVSFLAVSTALTRPTATPGAIENLGDALLFRTGAYDAFTMTRMDGTAWTRTLTATVERLEPDLVHLHGLDRVGADIVTLLRNRFPRLRLALTLHDYQLICAHDGLFLKRHDGALCGGASPAGCQTCFPDIAAERHALRTARLRTILGMIDAFVAPSAFIRQRFVDWGLPAERIHLIRNAVPDWGDADWQQTPRTSPNRFAYLGNVCHHKGITTLLQAARLLMDDPAGIRITVHGDLVHPSDEVRTAVTKSMSDAWPVVQHLGRYRPEDVPALLARTDWVVLPALWHENAPLTVVEALQAGRPVICPPVGGLSELVRDGVNGLHVPRGDAFALADTLRSAATDRGLWTRLSKGTREHPDFQSHLDDHRTLFETLVRKVPA